MVHRVALLKSLPLQIRSRETLRRLLDATEQLLAERHFEDIPIKDILTRSDVSAGSFYMRFRSKDDLLPHLYQSYSDDLRERMKEATDPAKWCHRPLAERIRQFVGRAIATYRERRGLLRAVALLARSRPQAVATSSLRERDDQYRAAARLLLECRPEIAHPNPEIAVRTGLFFVLAACRDKILFAEAPHPASLRLSETQLAAELSTALHAYLTAQPSLPP